MRHSSLGVVVLLLLCVGFLLTPFVLRSSAGNASLISVYSYAHLSLAQNIVQPDAYPVGGAVGGGFDYIVASLLGLFSPLVIGRWLPFVLGLLAFSLFLGAFRSLCDDDNEFLIGGLLFLISPLFLVSFTTLQQFSLVLVIVLAALWLVQSARQWFGASLLLLLPFIDMVGFFVGGAVVLGVSLLFRRARAVAFMSAVGVVLVVFLDVFGFAARDPLVDGVAGTLFASFGGTFGYSFFILLLALMGIVALWRPVNTVIAGGAFLFGVFVVSFSVPVARVVLLPVVVVLAARGVLLLFRRSWAISSGRHIALFLIGLSLLFTLVSTFSALSAAEPSVGRLEALRFLRTVPQDEVVLSSANNGIFIQRIAQRRVLVDEFRNDDVAVFEDVDTMFSTVRLRMAADLFAQYGVSHVFIDEEMRSGGVWLSDSSGLLFLMQNNDLFVKVYEKDGFVIYRFLGDLS